MQRDTPKKTRMRRHLLALSSAALLLAGCEGGGGATTRPAGDAVDATATQPVVDTTSPQDEVAVPGAGADPTATAVGIE